MSDPDAPVPAERPPTALGKLSEALAFVWAVLSAGRDILPRGQIRDIERADAEMSQKADADTVDPTRGPR
jgi:hypothetical protein